MAYNLTPSGGNADLAGKTVVTLDGYEVTYDTNGYARQSVSPSGETKFYDSLGNQTSVPPDLRVSPGIDPQAPVLPVSTQMPITDTIPESSIGATGTTTNETDPVAASISDSEIVDTPRPVFGSGLAEAQAASGTEEIANFGTTAPPVNLESDAVLAARNASGTDTTDFLSGPKPVIGDGVVDAQLASNTASEIDPSGFTGSTFGTSFGSGLGDFGGIDIAALNAQTRQAQQQQSVSTLRGQLQSNDWRVRLQLAPGATYLYNSKEPGILQPLRATDGVIFPYTPKIDLTYKANYQTMDLTHSNYRGYFYQNSMVESINVTANFTAQSTSDANYLLAVIHFFRSVTKMFYGQDAERGSPPPLVYFSGLGQYQFNSHPCVVSAFNYNLPDDVDYIRAQVANQNGLNMAGVSNVLQTVATNIGTATLTRLATASINKGALTSIPFGALNMANLASGNPTYVPTKMTISLTLLPMQSRQQVSQQFSLKQFANGNQLKGGFW